MIVLESTDIIEVGTSSAALIDVLASFTDVDDTPFGVTALGNDPTPISSVAETTVLAAPASGFKRLLNALTIRNKDASLACDVIVQLDRTGTETEMIKRTLLAGDTLLYEDGIGWVHITVGRTDRWMRVTGSDYVNATTSFSDITGLTCPVLNGHIYNFEAHLFHAANASTTGPRFGINGPSLTAIQVLQAIRSVTLTSVDATVVESQAAGPATAVDTSAGGATLTGNTSVTDAILTGVFTAGADGTFAMRGQSEIAVAAGLTVKIGSWLHVWEATG